MRDVPVNVAHVVAGDVFAQLLEVHAAPLEAAQIRAAHRVVHEAVRADFDAADGFEEFGDGHGKFFILYYPSPSYMARKVVVSFQVSSSRLWKMG